MKNDPLFEYITIAVLVSLVIAFTSAARAVTTLANGHAATFLAALSQASATPHPQN